MNDEYVLKSDCKETHEKSLGLLTEINNRLYKDNGRKSIQSVLNDHERILAVVCWVSGIAATATITGAIAIGWMLVKQVIRSVP